MTLVVAPLARDAVRVVGDDSASFLQGQLSQEVETLAVGDSTWSFVLQPQGKVDAWVGVARLSDDEYVLDVDPGFGVSLLARLERFKLRVKVDLFVVPGVQAVAIRGVGARGVTLVGDAPEHRYERPVCWPGVGGVDVLAMSPLSVEMVRGPDGDPLPTIDPVYYEGLRIQHGVPAMGHEITDKTIPAELGQWMIDSSVSFAKGCYTGQELVARIDSRGGHVPRHLRVVAIDSEEVPPVGTELRVGGASVGSLTSSAPAPTSKGSIGLALVGRAVQPPCRAQLSWDDHAAVASILAGP